MERGSSSSWVRNLAQLFSAHGLNVPQLFEQAGLSLDELDNPHARFAPDPISKLWELAVHHTGNPALGMDRRCVQKHVHFDVISHFMLTCPNLRTGLKRLSTYLALISDAATFDLHDQGQDLWLTLGHIGNQRPVPRQRQEFGLLCLAVLCEWVTHGQARVRAVESSFVSPADPTPYLQAFGCRVSFGCAHTRLMLDAAALDAPLPSHDGGMLQLHERLMDERLHELGRQGVCHQVTQAIASQLHQGEPQLRDIARTLGCSEHTLQRRLRAEHTHFSALLEQTRKELAGKYMANPHLNTDDLANLLGFADTSNLFRACKRWFGLSPAAYRAQLSP